MPLALSSPSHSLKIVTGRVHVSSTGFNFQLWEDAGHLPAANNRCNRQRDHKDFCRIGLVEPSGPGLESAEATHGMPSNFSVFREEQVKLRLLRQLPSLRNTSKHYFAVENKEEYHAPP